MLPNKSPTAALAVSVFALALVAGLPALGGGFLSGDDYHLVRNHVLVNHPSITHALKIFTIVHRDLYQPIPLLSFSLDFALLQVLGLDPVAEGPNAGAWVFHLTNILIHAVNALLVFFLLKRLTECIPQASALPSVGPAVAAAIFALHPLAAEPIAWLNGRMMMLSTCFTLAAVITLDRWDRQPTSGKAIFTVLFSILAHMSKISVALPIFALILPLAQRRRPTPRWWAMWAVLAIITTGFTALAVYSSGEMFQRAEEEMSGPAALYVLLALGQYFRQFLIPLGLSAWYPPPFDVSWTQPLAISSAVTVFLVLAITLASVRRTRVGLLGLLWFIAAVGPTLPIVPARRTIAADRYVYLPNIGLQWIVATVLVALFVHLRRRPQTQRLHSLGSRWSSSQILLTLTCAAAAITLVTTSWHTQSYYRDDIALAQRIIQCNPDYPSVYESAAWAYYREGQYQNAIRIAAKDLELHPETMACEVYQVVGMSQFRLQRYDDALESLHKAIQADPDYGKCYSRLAKIQAHLQQYDAAIENYERAAQIMPYYNPGLLNLARVYRTVGRIEDAVRTYEQVLTANPYDVTAQLALAEIDIQHRRFHEAVTRLETLLDWMPENTIARTNFGLAHEALNHTRAAIDAYTAAINRDPNATVAVVNLASLYIRQNRLNDAQRLFTKHLPDHDNNVTFLIAYHDFALLINRPDLAAEAFLRTHNRKPQDRIIREWTAYTLAQAQGLRPPGNHPTEATRLLPSGVPTRADAALPLLTQTLIALQANQPESAIANVSALLELKTPTPADAKQRLIADLERFATTHPDNPWPYYLSAMILIAQGQRDFAQLALKEFIRLCPAQDCQSRARDLSP